ncbi:MAG: hypothetical protein HY423_06590 [Candidatus Lambdaproteobacteria bacterium]|nr:hypothetical protein [Candidatus Lambdaproteobacteria bacterium]
MRPVTLRFQVWWYVLAAAAVLFGLVTLVSGGRLIFRDAAAVAAAGNYVPFVLWSNWLLGFGYVAAGVGLWRGQRWCAWLAIAIAAATALVFAAFGVHVALGGAYEPRTVAALTLRLWVWLVIAAVAYVQLVRPRG